MGDKEDIVKERSELLIAKKGNVSLRPGRREHSILHFRNTIK